MGEFKLHKICTHYNCHLRAAGSCQEVDVNTFVIYQLPRIQLREVDANTIEQELRIALVTPPLVEDICLSREVEGYT